MIYLPTLYKTTKTGAVQEWTICYGQDTQAYYKIYFGQQDGAIQEKINYVRGKNIGRANETSDIEQAESEAKSRWLAQKDKGYLEHGEKPSELLLPMLAQDYKKYSHKVKFPCYIQPKLDGSRMVAQKVGNNVVLYSRKGKKLTLPHIEDTIRHLPYESITLDGELYKHGVEFQELMSWSKKSQANTLELEYHVYDIFCTERTFSERFVPLQNLSRPLVLVDTHLCYSIDDIKGHHEGFISCGFEGTMIKNANGKYLVNARSYDILKYKDFLEEEFEIIGGEENEKMPGQCSIILKTKDGAIFRAKPEGSTYHREKLWETIDSLVGKIGTVKFFEWTTSEQPVPRFPVFKSVRDYD